MAAWQLVADQAAALLLCLTTSVGTTSGWRGSVLPKHLCHCFALFTHFQGSGHSIVPFAHPLRPLAGHRRRPGVL